MTSAQPDASILYGALLMIAVSASIARGDTAVFETDPALCFSDARGEATPSCDAHVGTLTNGLVRSKAASFVTSMTLHRPLLVGCLFYVYLSI